MKLVILFWLVFQIPWSISRRSAYTRKPEPCPKDMVRYMDESNNTVTYCDCQKTFLYNTEDDSCYDAYRQGPCPPENYFVLSPGETVAKCEKNPCVIDGLVLFQDECYRLWNSDSPCEEELHQLTINEITFEIECSDKSYNGDRSNLAMSKFCAENSILVKENGTKWTCDCKPGFLKDLKNDSCHEAYRQGPCPPEHFFILSPEEKEAKCEKNSCLEDGLVPFENGCHKLNSFEPCKGYYYYLGVDTKNFQLKCIYTSRRHHGGHHAGGGIINAPTKACPPGSRRVFTGCKRAFQ